MSVNAKSVLVEFYILVRKHEVYQINRHLRVKAALSGYTMDNIKHPV